MLTSILPTRYMHCLSGLCCGEHPEVVQGTEREEYKMIVVKIGDFGIDDRRSHLDAMMRV